MLIHGKLGVMQKVLIIFSLFYFLLTTVVVAEGVSLKLGSTEVVDGSPLKVQIVAEGKNIEFPDVQDIGGFPVEGSSISSKLESSYINGNFSSKSLKTLSFEFYPEVNMTIPSFAVKINGKTYKTKETAIRVLDPSEVKEKSVDGYTLRLKANRQNVYVGEPFIVMVDFFEPRNSSVVKVEYTPPKFKDFFSQSLGEEKLKRSSTGTLHQLQYLVTAKKDGKLTIMPPKARVGIKSFSGANRDPFGFFSNDIKWHLVRAKPLTIQVKAVPHGIDLMGKFNVESRVDRSSVKPNAPVTYTLKISGEGSLDDLDNPKFSVPGVTVYGDDPKVTSRVVGGKVLSEYERKYVFISDKDFTIPDLYFKNFDFISKKTNRLKTKRYEIKIDGNALTTTKMDIQEKNSDQASAQPLGNAREQKISKEKNESILEDSQYYQEKESKERIGYPLWSVLLAFILGIIVAVVSGRVFRFIKKSGNPIRAKRYSNNEALKILYPHTNQNKKVEAMVRKLYEVENGNKNVTIDADELSRIIQQLQS